MALNGGSFGKMVLSKQQFLETTMVRIGVVVIWKLTRIASTGIDGQGAQYLATELQQLWQVTPTMPDGLAKLTI